MLRNDIATVIVEKVAKETGFIFTVEDCIQMIANLCKIISDTIKEGNVVSIRGFGTFKPKYYNANVDHTIFDSTPDENKNKPRQNCEFVHPAFKAGKILRTEIKPASECFVSIVNTIGDEEPEVKPKRTRKTKAE